MYNIFSTRSEADKSKTTVIVAEKKPMKKNRNAQPIEEKVQHYSKTCHLFLNYLINIGTYVSNYS